MSTTRKTNPRSASIKERRDTILAFGAGMLKFWRIGLFALLLSGMLAACRRDMHDQPKYKPYRPSPFFEDGLSSRPLVEGTVPRGYLREDMHLYAGKTKATQPPSAKAVSGREAKPRVKGQGSVSDEVDTFPFPVTRAVLNRGQERFNIYCSTCHGRVGNGEGMIVRRGFRQPPSFHIDRLREDSVGHFFDVITNGFGAMPSYADQVAPHDRWAIIAYIRALQLSQRATLSDVPAEERTKLQIGGPVR